MNTYKSRKSFQGTFNILANSNANRAEEAIKLYDNDDKIFAYCV